MTTFESDLERRLEDLAQTADPAGEGRVLRGVKRTERNRRRGKVAAFALGVAIAAVGVLSLNGLDVIGNPSQGNEAAQRPGGAHTPSIGDGRRLVEPGEPCPMARHAKSVKDLKTNAPIWEPANATLTDAWTCGSTPVLMYGQIQITYDWDPRVWGNIDVKAKWDRFVRDRGGRVETVLGRPAYVRSDKTAPPTNLPPNEYMHRGPGRGRNAVQVVVDGTLISTVAKDDVPLEKLIELTNSIQLPPALQRESN